MQFITRALQNTAPRIELVGSKQTSILHFSAKHPEDSNRSFVLVDVPGHFYPSQKGSESVWRQAFEWLRIAYVSTIIYIVTSLNSTRLPSQDHQNSIVILLVDNGDSLPNARQLSSRNFAIAKTKCDLHLGPAPVHSDDEELSKSNFPRVSSHHDTPESAWKILDSVQAGYVDVSKLKRDLKGALTADTGSKSHKTALLSFRRLIEALGALLKHLNSANSSSRADVSSLEGTPSDRPTTDPAITLEILMERLSTAFNDPDQYKRLLSYHGKDAQEILDTLHLVCLYPEL